MQPFAINKIRGSVQCTELLPVVLRKNIYPELLDKLLGITFQFM